MSLDFKLEVVVLPVSDVDHAKAFYASLGWREDADFILGEGARVVQFTPPGSGASIHVGNGITDAAPGSVRNTYLIVDNIVAAREELLEHGVKVSDVFHYETDHVRVPGPAPEHGTYASFAEFADPDGNTWLLQEVTTRLAGRVNGAQYGSAAELAAAIRRATQSQLQRELCNGPIDGEWPDWYADRMIAEQSGPST
jgi:catechol 2,3-dioxygenase-like lactoylglutathione lyase family enzyme